VRFWIRTTPGKEINKERKKKKKRNIERVTRGRRRLDTRWRRRVAPASPWIRTRQGKKIKREIMGKKRKK
jgi:hypothetical protein